MPPTNGEHTGTPDQASIPPKVQDRVKTLDRLRGLSIMYMLVVHLFTWVRVEDAWWFYASFPLTNFIGGCTFTFVAGAGLTLSMRKVPQTPARVHHFRSLFILGIGLIENIFYPGFPYVWGWTILFALGIFRLLGYYVAKLPIWVRVILIAAILVAARPLLLSLTGEELFANGVFVPIRPTSLTDDMVVPYLLFNLPEQNTLLPYFGFFLGGTIFAELVILEPNGKQATYRAIFALLGSLLVAAGLTLGFLFPTRVDLGDYIIGYLGIGGKYIDQFPSFLSRNSIPWSMTAMGAQFILAVLFLQLEQKVYNNRFLTIYGEFSLTIYVFHGPLYFLSNRAWPIVVAGPLIVLTVLLIYWLCMISQQLSKGKVSLEYAINSAVKAYSKHLKNVQVRKNGFLAGPQVPEPESPGNCEISAISQKSPSKGD